MPPKNNPQLELEEFLIILTTAAEKDLIVAESEKAQISISEYCRRILFSKDRGINGT